MDHFWKVVVGCWLGLVTAASGREKMPIDPLWKSAEFRSAFTGSYGIDSRIEPKVTTEEKAVLEKVGAAMEGGDRANAMAKLVGSPLLDKSAAMIFTLANLRFEEGEAEDAAEGYERALALYPNFRDAHRNLAVVLVRQGEMEKAEPHLRRALELGAQDGMALGLLGYCHASAGRDQAALQAYRLAQLTMPDELQWKLGEADALMALDDLGAAGSIYEEVLEIRPSEAGIWTNLADVRLRQGESELAVADLEVARRLGGLNPTGVISLGHLYLNESLVGEAVECYEEGISGEDAPPFGTAVNAVEHLALFRHWKEAKGIAEKVSGMETYAGEFAKAGDRDAPQVAGEERRRFDRVRALLELEIGDASAGSELVGGLLKEDPMDGQALILMAKFKLGAGEGEEAEMLLEQAARIPEFEAEALRELGELLVGRGDYERALKPLRRAFELDPDGGFGEYLEAVEGLVR